MSRPSLSMRENPSTQAIEVKLIPLSMPLMWIPLWVVVPWSQLEILKFQTRLAANRLFGMNRRRSQFQRIKINKESDHKVDQVQFSNSKLMSRVALLCNRHMRESSSLRQGSLQLKIIIYKRSEVKQKSRIRNSNKPTMIRKIAGRSIREVGTHNRSVSKPDSKTWFLQTMWSRSISLI